MSDATRKCPFTGCVLMVRPQMFCCRSHWALLTEEEKNRIYSAYEGWREGNVLVGELREVQTEVIEQVEARGGVRPDLADAMKPAQKQARCNSCGRPILWARTASGNVLVPLDPNPVAGGNISLRPDGTAVVVGHKDIAAAVDEARGEPTYHLSHFTTCPNAKNHRRRGNSRA